VAPDRVHRVGGPTAVFAADLIPTTAHVDVPWIMGYDLYPMETLAFKRAFVREADRARVHYLLRARSAIAAGYIRERDGVCTSNPTRAEPATGNWNWRLETGDWLLT
jgi:hypothetical protein